MNRIKRTNIFKIFEHQRPQPKTELRYTNVFELLIAVILSAQATDISVNKITNVLFVKAKTPDDVIKLGESKLMQIIKSIGLYRSKARNIIRTCEILSSEYSNKVPENRELLERLPGVGRKTANVVLNTYFGWNTIAVDTHVFRVSNRTGIATGRKVEIVESKLDRLIPDNYKKNAHHWLILHGRYICKARTPLCHRCPISDLCEFKQKNTTEANPS